MYRLNKLKIKKNSKPSVFLITFIQLYSYYSYQLINMSKMKRIQMVQGKKLLKTSEDNSGSEQFLLKQLNRISPLKARESLDQFQELLQIPLESLIKFEKYDQRVKNQNNYQIFLTPSLEQNKNNIKVDNSWQMQLNISQQFSFRQNHQLNQINRSNIKKSNQAIKQDLWRQIKPKIIQLVINKNKLYDQCIKLKKQFIIFERQHKFIFEDFEKKISKPLITVIIKQRMENQKLKQILQYFIDELEEAKVREGRINLAREKSQCDLNRYEITVRTLNQELKKTNEQMCILLSQNEQFFNQNSQLQKKLLKLNQQVEQIISIRTELKESKEYIKQLLNHSKGLDQLKTLEKDIIQYRIDIETKIKQEWSQFIQKYDQLLPICEKNKQIFTKFEVQSAYLTQISYFKQKLEKKIVSIVDYQTINYIELNDLENNIVMTKLYTLLELMNEIKHSIFAFLDENKLTFVKENLSILVQQCGKSLYNLNHGSKGRINTARHDKSTQFDKSQDGTYTRQKSDRFLKQSILTMRTTESQAFRGLTSSESEPRFMLKYHENQAYTQNDSLKKLSDIKGRLKNLRKKVKSNIQSFSSSSIK